MVMNDGIYLHTRYVDPRRARSAREREYADDGTVWVTVVDGERFGPVPAGRRAGRGGAAGRVRPTWTRWTTRRGRTGTGRR